MTVGIIFLILGFWFARNIRYDDSVMRARFNLTCKFIRQYEEKMGVKLTYEQASILLKLAIDQIARDKNDRISLDSQYKQAQDLVDNLCAEAEQKAFRKY